ncbi:MAG: nitrous oxide reductase family maturation protein NosD, partial [Gammaproteobacteria bacterium]|nr:nitrous oxide reductase family maturation protein NosD [Gammaproteobacteria bacterium]
LMESNLIAFNSIGILFHNDWTGNIARNNSFKDNMNQVVVLGGGSANRNVWEGNYWDDYEGFDTNNDGIGDTPYQKYDYADRLWMDIPNAQFFKATPVLEFIDLLERLAPFSEPELLIEDTKPLFNNPLSR